MSDHQTVQADMDAALQRWHHHCLRFLPPSENTPPKRAPSPNEWTSLYEWVPPYPDYFTPNDTAPTTPSGERDGYHTVHPDEMREWFESAGYRQVNAHPHCQSGLTTPTASTMQWHEQEELEQEYPDEVEKYDPDALDGVIDHTNAYFAKEERQVLEILQEDPEVERAREMGIMERALVYFTATDDESRHIHRDSAVGFQSLGKVMPAKFFGRDGQPLISSEESDYRVSTSVALRLETHLSHIRVFARGRPIIAETRHDQQPDRRDETRFARPDYDPEINTDDMVSIASVVSAYINHASYQQAELTDCSSTADLSDNAQAFLESLPQNIRQTIAEMNDEERQPHILEIQFDPAYAALERIHIGTPSWAVNFAAAIREGRIFALVQGNLFLKPRLQIIVQQFYGFRSGNTPLRQYQTKNAKRLLFDKSSICIPEVRETTSQRDDIDYQVRRVFHDIDEYNTIQAVSILSDKRKESLDVASFGESTRLRCARLPGSDDQRVFLGWLPTPDHCTLRASNGTQFDIIFLGKGESIHDLDFSARRRGRVFKARVASDAITCGPSEYIPVHISRPYNATDKTFHNQPVHFVDVNGVSAGEIRSIIRLDTGNRVWVRWDVQTKIHACQLAAVEHFSYPGKNRGFLDWNLRAHAVVVGSRVHTLIPRDILADIRISPMFGGQELSSLMSLNGEQCAAVEGMRSAPGGFVIIQGPSGTGKSRIWEELVKLVLRSGIDYQILITSPANSAVDTIASKLEAVLRDLQATNVVTPDQYILRIHSASSEKVLGGMEAKKTRPATRNERPSNFPQDIVMEQLDEATKLFVAQYREATKTKFEGIYDPRVKLPHLSAMMVAIEKAGIIQGPRTVTNPNKWRFFRQKYTQYAQGIAMDREARMTWEALVHQLWVDTLQEAKVIIATTAQAGMSCVVDSIQTSCRLIIVDEAAHQPEVGLIPLFAQRFQNLEGFVQIGDMFQLNPMVIATNRENIYADQGRISLMSRMVAYGFQPFTLTEQHRFVLELADLANQTTYNYQLTSTNEALLSRRQMAQKFSKFAFAYIGKQANKLLLDVASGKANKVERTTTSSRYNEFFVQIESLILFKLLQIDNNASIAILTAYRAQKERLMVMFNNMKAADVPGVERVTIATSDSVQGEQYDYVVLDILVPDSEPSLGFQGDPNRLTMETTRARNGLIIITNVQALGRCKQARFGYIARLLNAFNGYRCKLTGTDAAIHSQFYTPTRPRSSQPWVLN